MTKKIQLALFLFFSVLSVCGQSYNAIHGSSYFSTLNVANNPAAVVQAPHRWELTVFALQNQAFSNAFQSTTSSFLKFPGMGTYRFVQGDFDRKAYVNADLHLFNLRLALKRGQAIAFGANFRGYGELSTSPFNYSQSVSDVESFFASNQQTSMYDGKVTSSSWIEFFGTYGRTLKDDSREQLNVGVTLKGSLGLSGAYAQVTKVYSGQRSADGGAPEDYLSHGAAEYGYSNHYEGWAETQALMPGIKQHIAKSLIGTAIDIGVEYRLLEQEVMTAVDEATDSYKWKIGLSLLDLGFNRYTYSSHSRQVSTLRDGITSQVLRDKFAAPADIRQFNDSLATIVESSERLQGNFRIVNPMRMVLNVDRNLGRDVYVNGQLVLNFAGLYNGQALTVRENQLLTITPRWENRRFGFYLPVQYNRMHQFWVGSAFKAGPMLLGVHNVFSALNREKAFNGGFYLALVLRPPSQISRRSNTGSVDCPIAF